MIGHTQPRRIAARSVAERIAEELDVTLGEQVGYQVRFTEQAQRDTLVKVMTDGILLSEMQRDRDLRRYDTLIIDEAHERSMNTDILIGVLSRVVKLREEMWKEGKDDMKVRVHFLSTRMTLQLLICCSHFVLSSCLPRCVYPSSQITRLFLRLPHL